MDTSFLAHSYFGDVASVVSDLEGVLHGVAPADRSTVTARRGETGSYYQFKR